MKWPERLAPAHVCASKRCTLSTSLIPTGAVPKEHKKGGGKDHAKDGSSKVASDG
jgi:hypothetical protein